MSDSCTISMKKRRNVFFLAFCTALLLADAVLIAAAGGDAHAIVKNSCSSSRYPDLCYSTIASTLDELEGASEMVTSHKDVIQLALNITINAVHQNSFKAKQILMKRKNLTTRQKMALNDCLQTTDFTLDELHEVVEDLKKYPEKKTLPQHAEDFNILLSAAITNQDTCIDGFSHDEADKIVGEELAVGESHVGKLCSNVLAMIMNMTDTDMANEQGMNSNSITISKGRKLEEDDESDTSWPEWLSAGDRRLLQSSHVTPDVVVAADGSGDFRTLTEAVEAAPDRSPTRYVIRIKVGRYHENVELNSRKHNIMLMGDGRTNTVITGNRSWGSNYSTFNSFTVAAVGQGFLARDITFENTAGPSNHQAVALRVGSDFSAFYRCAMLAYQDTLYVHTRRQFYVDCYISGTVDFIFGNAAAVFQDCDIHARRGNPGQRNMITAQSRTDPNENTGIVIQKCRLSPTLDLSQAGVQRYPTYLGRPWRAFAKTVVMQSRLDSHIHPEGWHEWDEAGQESKAGTLYYREYDNFGGGADTSERVDWDGFKVITDPKEAEAYTAGEFFFGGTWLNSTGFPFCLGLSCSFH